MHTEYALDEYTRAFLSELFRELGQSLKPGRPQGVELLQRFLETHLGVTQADQAIVSREYARPLSNQILVALEEVLGTEPFRTGRTVDYDDTEGERAPRFRSVPISPTESRSVLEEGYYAVHRGDTPLVVGVALRDRLQVWIHLRRADIALGETFFEGIEACQRLYRGQVVSLSDEGFPLFLTVPETRFEGTCLPRRGPPREDVLAREGTERGEPLTPGGDPPGEPLTPGKGRTGRTACPRRGPTGRTAHPGGDPTGENCFQASARKWRAASKDSR
jgi:hypothetical protein